MRNIKINLRPSKVLAAILISIHAVAMMILVTVKLPAWLVIFGLACIFLSAVTAVCRQAYHLTAKAVVQFWKSEGTEWMLLSNNGHCYQASLSGDSIVTRYFSLLRFHIKGRFFTLPVIILPDAIDADDFRRLRVYLLVR